MRSVGLTVLWMLRPSFALILNCIRDCAGFAPRTDAVASSIVIVNVFDVAALTAWFVPSVLTQLTPGMYPLVMQCANARKVLDAIVELISVDVVYLVAV